MDRLSDDDIRDLCKQFGTNAYLIAQVTGRDHSSIAKRIRRLCLRPKKEPKARRHLVIPDCQVKDGVDISYLSHIGAYAAEKKPDVIVCIGDFADMPSLSSYDRGKKSFEGRRYKKDIDSVIIGMSRLMEPIDKVRNDPNENWEPQLHLTLGNHENRISRAVEADPILDGTIGIEDLDYEGFGWKVHEFLKPVVIDDIAYAHYFTSGVLGRPVSSARQLAIKKHQSCVMGHVQNWDMHREVRANGVPFIGLFAGSCYTHDEDYLGPQGNNYWRGIWLLNEIDKGDFQPMALSLDYLRKRYG